MKNILPMFVDWLNERNTNVSKKTLEIIDKDILQLYLDEKTNIVYIEETGGRVPDYVIRQIELFSHDNGYKLWYE